MGLPAPAPGAPTLRWRSALGLTKSRELFGAGEADDSIGLDMGMLFEWSTPAVLRMEGLSA